MERIMARDYGGGAGKGKVGQQNLLPGGLPYCRYGNNREVPIDGWGLCESNVQKGWVAR